MFNYIFYNDKALKKQPAAEVDKKENEEESEKLKTAPKKKEEEKCKKTQFEDLLAPSVIKKEESIVDSSVVNSLKSTGLLSYQNENKIAVNSTKGPSSLFDEHDFEINIDLSVPTINSTIKHFFFLNHQFIFISNLFKRINCNQ